MNWLEKSSLGFDIRRTYRLPVRIRYIRGVLLGKLKVFGVSLG